MSYLDALFLGLLQGLTEFLPVSSSGHLVLAEELLHVKQAGVTFELLLHLGTLFSVLIYFRSRIIALIRSLFDDRMRDERRLVLYIIVGTIPAGLAGVLLENFFERAFSSPIATSAFLITTGVILLATRFVPRASGEMTIKSTLIMGLGQAMAILPGISRSGSTISFGLFSRVKPEMAAEFSFLLAIPAILGAVVLKGKELMALDAGLAGQYTAGLITSFVFGLIAVHIVMRVIKRGRFEYFGYYCFAAGLLGLYLFA